MKLSKWWPLLFFALLPVVEALCDPKENPIWSLAIYAKQAFFFVVAAVSLCFAAHSIKERNVYLGIAMTLYAVTFASVGYLLFDKPSFSFSAEHILPAGVVTFAAWALVRQLAKASEDRLKNAR